MYNYFTELFVKTTKCSLVSLIQTVLVYDTLLYNKQMPKVTIQTPNIQGGQNTTETCNEIKCLTIQSSCSNVLCVCEDTGGVENESPRTMSSPRSLATSRMSRKRSLKEQQTNPQVNLQVNPQLNQSPSQSISFQNQSPHQITTSNPKLIACNE